VRHRREARGEEGDAADAPGRRRNVLEWNDNWSAPRAAAARGAFFRSERRGTGPCPFTSTSAGSARRSSSGSRGCTTGR
jgi:hypothetical protein